MDDEPATTAMCCCHAEDALLLPCSVLGLEDALLLGFIVGCTSTMMVPTMDEGYANLLGSILVPMQFHVRHLFRYGCSPCYSPSIARVWMHAAHQHLLTPCCSLGCWSCFVDAHCAPISYSTRWMLIVHPFKRCPPSVRLNFSMEVNSYRFREEVFVSNKPDDQTYFGASLIQTAKQLGDGLVEQLSSSGWIPARLKARKLNQNVSHFSLWMFS